MGDSPYGSGTARVDRRPRSVRDARGVLRVQASTRCGFARHDRVRRGRPRGAGNGSRGRSHPRSTRHVVLVGVIAIAVGVLAPLAGLIGIEVLAGAPISVIDRWAPDVALLFWILLAEIVLIAVLILLRAALSPQRWIARFAR